MTTDPGALKVIVDSVARLVARGPRGFPGKDGMAPGDLKFGVWLTMPTGYLYCDGSIYLKTDYPALYAAIGDQFTPAGTPSTHFGVPDWREREVRGATSMATAIGTKHDAVALASRNAAHDRSHNHAASSAVSGGVTSGGSGTSLSGGIAAANTDHNHTGPAGHPEVANTPTSGGQNRVTQGGHGSTGLAAQASGQSHSHGHSFGISDPGHGHGHSITVATTNTAAPSAESPNQYCHVLIKT